MPPDTAPADSLLWEALPGLTLNIAQTAALCGISVRQLGYWTQQGYVTAAGQGARRTYGLEAIRRVLAIRKAMDAGASLRQSLRQFSSVSALGDSAASDFFASDFSASDFSVSSFLPLKDSSLSAALDGSVADIPTPAHDAALRRSLIDFFETNCHTRDHAGGLAVKLGWSEEDVRVAADDLCMSGVLSCDVCQGMTVFRSAAGRKHG